MSCLDMVHCLLQMHYAQRGGSQRWLSEPTSENNISSSNNSGLPNGSLGVCVAAYRNSQPQLAALPPTHDLVR